LIREGLARLKDSCSCHSNKLRIKIQVKGSKHPWPAAMAMKPLSENSSFLQELNNPRWKENVSGRG
jgi:hypothetical protein